MMLIWFFAPYSLAIQPSDETVRPASIVVLVDESSSLSPADVQREREAAALIALGEFSPRSSIAVVGFGSDNGGQSPVDVVCPPVTVANAQDRQRLSDCVGKLRSRTAAEGDGTDHAAALQQAMSYLGGADVAEPKMIFLLTDGKLDVSDSPRYGPDNVNDQRNRAALAQTDRTLDAAKQAHVQVWPLGFGDVDRDRLSRFAESGYQGSCGPGSPKPTATFVSSSADVARALLTAFSSARCAGVGDIERLPLATGEDATATVTIPLIATDGSIIVVKGDPRVVVSYVDPNGQEVPKNEQRGDSTFQVSGENGVVEALRVVNPVSGPWKVRMTSFPGVPPLDVSAVVTWQGAVRAVLSVDPPSPAANQDVTVSVALQTRKRLINDSASLAGLSFTATTAGQGWGGPVALNDEAKSPDTTAGDGIYSGLAHVPAGAGGIFRVTGEVTGVGIAGDTRTVDAKIVESGSALSATASLRDTTVAPGGTLRGVVDVTNDSGRNRKVRLQIADSAPGTSVSVPGDRTIFEVPPAGRRSFDFDLVFADDTSLGANAFTLLVVDDDAPDSKIHERRVVVEVAQPPPWPLIIAAVVALLVLVLATFILVNWRRKRDVRGLVVYLIEQHRPCGDLAAPEQPSRKFRFGVDSDAGPVSQLAHQGPGESGYLLTRVGGVLRLRTPTGDVHQFHLGESVAIDQYLSIEVRDERAALLPDGEDLGTSTDWNDHHHSETGGRHDLL